jgi:hypothetical protein
MNFWMLVTTPPLLLAVITQCRVRKMEIWSNGGEEEEAGGGKMWNISQWNIQQYPFAFEIKPIYSGEWWQEEEQQQQHLLMFLLSSLTYHTMLLHFRRDFFATVAGFSIVI